MLPPSPADPSTQTAAPGPLEGARCALHPERTALAVCTRCGDFACVACAVVHPDGTATCAACRAKDAGGEHPWDHRKELGLAKAAGLVARGVLTRPTAFFALRPTERPLWPTLLLGLAFHLVGQVALTAWDLAYLDQTRAELQADPMGRMLLWTATREFHLAQLGLAPVVFVLGTYVTAALWWLGLRAVGGLNRPFDVLVRALCFAQAASLLLPLIAPLGFLGDGGAGFTFAYGMWATALQVVAVSRMQGIEPSRGALAFLVWMALAACVLFVGLSVGFWGLASHIKLPTGL